MKDFKISELDLVKDKPQIAKWDELRGAPEYEDIKKFILEDDLIRGLAEVIETNYEIIPIGEDEIKKAVVAKTSEGEVLGFMIYQVFDIKTKKPSMFLQYIVVNPKYKSQGYGKEIFSKFFSSPRKHTGGVSPRDVFAYVDRNNFQSQKLFLDFGFSLDAANSQFFKAGAILPEIQKRIQNQNAPNA